MTESMVELVWDVVRGISTHMHMLLQKHQQRKKVVQSPPKQSAVWVSLPVRITLRLQPGNKLLTSVELRQPFFLTPQELHTIEIHATQNHLSQEAELIELLKIALKGHEKMQEIIRQIHQRYSTDTQVVIEIELLGPIQWNERLLGLT